MPKLFTKDMFKGCSETVEVYADKHTPIIKCETCVKRNEKVKVNVRVGNHFTHPNTPEHYFTYIQLWSLEKLIAEVHFFPGTFGDKPMKSEIDFYIVPKVSMHLTAHAYCTKHGLWKSNEIYVKVID
ncbi:MAG: class II SORL domain-containing protein [Prevotellaceae bacterium]|jgi:superoxide reductase|nr:class II SORL domain-containing protein [Prevotellaceae bacterium]